MAISVKMLAPSAAAILGYTPDTNNIITVINALDMSALLSLGCLPVGTSATPNYFGGSTALFKDEGNISVQAVIAGVGNAADTTDDVLFTFTLPASAFDAAGRGINIAAFGKLAANGNNKRVKLWFGATVVADSGVVTGNNVGWELSAVVFKVGALGSNTQLAQGQPIVGATHGGASLPSAPTEVESGPIVVKVTGASGTTGAANDVLGMFFAINAMD